MEAEIQCSAEDVSLLKYLTDYSGKDDNLLFVLQNYGMSENTPAYGVFCLFDILSEKLAEENLNSLYRDVELPLTDVLYDMEECGVKIDLSAMDHFEKYIAMRSSNPRRPFIRRRENSSI